MEQQEALEFQKAVAEWRANPTPARIEESGGAFKKEEEASEEPNLEVKAEEIDPAQANAELAKLLGNVEIKGDEPTEPEKEESEEEENKT